jgi:inhibitor of cysteine peptidase
LISAAGGWATAPAPALAQSATDRLGAMVTLTDQDNGRRLAAHRGETIEIRLAENATTGYRWAPDAIDARLIEFVGATADYPSKALGSGGVAIFRFRVVGAGAGTLSRK